MQGCPTLEIVFRSSFVIGPEIDSQLHPVSLCVGKGEEHLLSAENQSLLYWWDALLLLDALLDAGDLAVSVEQLKEQMSGL